MNDNDVAWFAGLMDGEGSISTVRDKGSVVARVQCCMTCGRTIARMLDLLREWGIRGAGYCDQEKKPERHKPSHHLRVCRLADVGLLAGLMEPYAVTKQENWTLIREFAESRLSGCGLDSLGRVRRGGRVSRKPFTVRELAIHDELRVINHRGPS